jgi:tetratricopeptide (TPR) repeat protein
MKPKVLGILILVVLGVVKVPIEQALTESLRARGLQAPPPELGWQENFGQMALSSLGGLRNLVASISYLEAYAAWEDLDWGRVDTLMTFATRLQPTEPTYWDEGSWHMAFNAAGAYLRDKKLRYAIKHKLYNDHVQRGITILEEGLKFNPEHPLLLKSLGYIYMIQKKDSRLAAKYFLEAHAHGAPSMYERFAAYELVKVDDRASSEKAYEILKRYYDKGAPFTKMESLLRDLRILESRLNIPVSQRIGRNPLVPQIPGIPNPGRVPSDQPRLNPAQPGRIR